MASHSTTRLDRVAASVILGLIAPAALEAAVFTAGLGGHYPTIQGAVDAALASPGSHEVRVGKGLYPERVNLVPSDGSLRISGGWDREFLVQDPTAPGETIVHAGGAGRPLYVECTRGRLEVSHLMFTGGHLTSSSGTAGGGVMVIAQGTCDVRLSRNLVSVNTVEKTVPGDPVPAGGGLYGFVGDAARLAVSECTFFDNRLRNDSTGGTSGTGADFVVTGNGTLEVTDTQLVGNVAASVGSRPIGGGLSVLARDGSRVRLLDLLVTDNRLAGPEPLASGVRLAAGSECSDCEISLSRGEIRNNVGGRDAPQVFLAAYESGRVEVADSLVARAVGHGLWVDSVGSVALTNLTVVDHPGDGLGVPFASTGSISVFNTILFGNGVEASGLALGPSNLVGIDPLFVDRSGGNFRLSERSRAIDAGDDSPPDGLGVRDLDGRDRILGPHVDIGAYEHSALTAAPQLCDVEGHGTLPFVPATAPICSCLRREVLRSLQCGFSFPGWFVDLEVPWPLAPGQEIAPNWTLHPWGPIDGPYRVDAFLVVGGQEIPLEPGKGPTQGKIREGKDVGTTFRLQVPDEPAALRVRFLFQPDGAQEPSEAVTDVLLGPGGQEVP